MALNPNCIPGTITLAPKYAQSASAFAGTLVTTPAPKNTDGSVYDLSSATQFAIFADNGQVLGSYNYDSASVYNLTDETAGNPSARLIISPTQQNELFANLQGGTGTPGGRLRLQATDGTNQVTIATGTWNLGYTA